MNNKRTKGENVYQLVQKRLKFLFNEFDNIYVSFSGGKDSGVLLNLCIQYIREHNLDRKIGVYHMDYEAQYQMTTEYNIMMVYPISLGTTAFFMVVAVLL